MTSIFTFLRHLFSSEHVHRDSDRAGHVSPEADFERKRAAVARTMINF
jgi:hypothetical protein